MFWVQGHDIPYRYMMKQMAECLCDITREVKNPQGQWMMKGVTS